ncbi:MAG: VanZ family protein [Gaiellaceae bacterium]
MFRMRRSLSLWLPVVFWAAVIFALSAIPSLDSGLGTWDLVLRKLAHAAEYALLAALLLRALAQPWLAFLFALAYAASDELHQHFVRGRVGAPRDVAIDAAGALIGLLAYFYVRRRFVRLAAPRADARGD